MPPNKKILTVPVRFRRLIGVFLALTLVSSVLSLYTLNRLKVTGPIYTEISQQKDLLADILPPTLYGIEPYMVAIHLLEESNPATVQEEIAQIRSLQQDYVTRSEFWTQALNGSATGRLLSEDAHKFGIEFFGALEKEFIPAIQAQDKAAARALANGKLKSAYLEHRQAIDQAVLLVAKKSAHLESAAARDVRQSEILLLVVLASGFLFIIFYSRAVMLSLIQILKTAAEQLAQGCVQVSSAASQISSSSHTLSSASSEQASSVEETSASLEEMTSMIRATAENAQKAKALALEARSVVAAGCQTMGDMDRTMGEMNQAMAAIESSSGEVAKIVKGIDEIAFKNNIMALNAAVEAESAGEAGAGFALVAD